ncbi:MAG: endolytic transglycosylase MltG [Thermodesulfovibrionales bacterium]|nr:endolytic transglycosylase MltG [Thermodesulfovibrionales bacterium]
MKSNIKLILLSVPILFLIYTSAQLLIPRSTIVKQIEVEIPEGASFKEAANILSKHNLIRNKNIFLIIGRLSGLDKRVRAGYYSFCCSDSPFNILKALKNGKIIEYEITIVEGDSILEIGDKLASNNIMAIKNFNNLVTDKDFLDSLDIDAPSLEGYLFPQTYKFPKGMKPENTIKVMVAKLKDEFTEEMSDRAEEIGLSKNQVLTMASIIEKEAFTDEERLLISAVYHNRLKKKMPLQADPTAVYGIKSSRQKITKSDLRNKTPYNTYIIKGLPPGPIASSGIKSIKAALYPADVPYLYFVSNKDGTHQFSKTLSEHNDAVKKIRAKRDNE